MKYAYLRVSTAEQNLDRQIEAVREYCPELKEDCVYADKQSGKDFERKQYQAMKKVLRPGDEVIVKELDRLGRNKDGVKSELEWFKSHGVVVRILDIPTTLMDVKGNEWVLDMVTNIIVEVISAIAEQERVKIKARQAEGIACAKEKGVKFGRPKKEVECVRLPGESVADACTRLGVGRTYWYSHA